MLGSDNVLTFTCNEAEEFLVLTTNGIGVELHRLDEGGSVTNTVSLPGEFVDFFLGGEHMMCLGYPTGGGAYILPYFEIYITANSDVQGGAAEFVSFALSQEAMTAPTLTRSFLPTTQDAMLALLDQSTYYYYEDDPTAWLPYNQYEGSAAVVSGVYLFHLLDSAVPDMEKALKYSNSGKVKEIVLTAEDKDAFLALLNADGAVSSAAGNTVINAILEEELSAYYSGAKTLEDVAALIQSRVWIYLNE